MKIQTKKLSAWLALLIVSGSIVCPIYVRADANASGIPSPSLLVCAEVTASIGQNQKAEPADQNKTTLGQFVPCKQGDQLTEGTVVQTGKELNACLEIKWSKFITRLFKDSMARITPNARRVFLSTGDLLFKKDQHCPDVYTVETKRLQARIRGTTVRVHSGVDRDLIEVIECHFPVEVTNVLNGSVVNLTPGVVMEVRGKITTKGAPTSILQERQPISQYYQGDLRLQPAKGEIIFEDKYSTTIAYTANSKAILEDPMVIGGPNISPIDSIDLIRTTMQTIPSSDNSLGNILEYAINFGQPDKIISKNLSISKVPDCDYMIGPNIGWTAPSLLGMDSEFIQGAIKLPRTNHKPVCPIRKYHTAMSSKVAPAMMIPGIPIVPAPAGEPISAPSSEQYQTQADLAIDKHDSLATQAN